MARRAEDLDLAVQGGGGKEHAVYGEGGTRTSFAPRRTHHLIGDDGRGQP